MTTAPPVRRRPAPIRATVGRTTRLSPNFVRVTVSGDGLERFRWPGPAGHFKLMIPESGATDIALPEPDADGMVAFDRSTPLTMRTYTARRFDPERRELDVDVFRHGSSPISKWVENARPGSPVAVSVPRAAGFTEDPAADWILIAGDASAVPAIATIVPTLTKPATVIVDLDDSADRAALDAQVPSLDATGANNHDLDRVIAEYSRPAGRGQIWVAAEAALIRRIRIALLEEFDRDQFTTRGYWRAGEVNHPDHDYGED